MTLGFYYHIPVREDNNKLFLPGYLAVFIDELAKHADKLILFMHREEKDRPYADTQLLAGNIEWVDMSEKGAAWQRVLHASKYMDTVKNKIAVCDYVLVRAPSPLAPYFFKNFKSATTITYLIVGDYAVGAKDIKQPLYRRLPIQLLLNKSDRDLTKALTNCRVLVNSSALFNRYKDVSVDLHEVRTTTLSEADFHHKDDTCDGSVINLLYTGRYDWAKGLRELIEAVNDLHQLKYDIVLHIVGWEETQDKPVENGMKELIASLGIEGRVIIHGRKKLGAELNAMYKMADIYLLPSYHEGFPRTIWEAMANSLPVITTSVGSIPSVLTDRKDSIIIQPKDKQALINAIQEVIRNKELRQNIIANGRELAKGNTLSVQVKKMVDIIKQ